MKFDLQAANIERAVRGWKVKVPLTISTDKYTNAQWYSTARGIHSAMIFYRESARKLLALDLIIRFFESYIDLSL